MLFFKYGRKQESEISRKTRRRYPRVILMGIKIGLSDVIVHFDEAAIRPAKKRGKKKNKFVSDTVRTVR